MATALDSLTTLDNAKAQMKVAGSADDDLISAIVDRASDWIEGRVNRKLKARNYNNDTTQAGQFASGVDSEDYFYINGASQADDGDAIVDPTGYGIYHCPQFPIQRPSVTGALPVELAVLTYRTTGADGAGDTWSTTLLLEGRDYLVDYARGIIRLINGRFSPGLKNYRLKCTAGYYQGDNHPYLPQDIELLCIELVKLVYKDRANLLSERIGGWQRVFQRHADSPFIADTLDKYSRIL